LDYRSLALSALLQKASHAGWLALLASLVACSRVAPGPVAPPAASVASPGPAVAFTDVTVVTMLGAAEIPHATVVVRGDRIERVGAVEVPAGARIIEGHGRYLMPGLTDMHVHLPADAPDAALERITVLSLLGGVTTLRSMQGAPNHLAFRTKVHDGSIPSPELYLAGPPLAETFTPEEIRARVREQKAAGYDFIKVLGGFDRAAYDALIVEARSDGLPVVGHVPAEIGIDTALASRQVTIEHLMGYGDAAKAGDAALDALATRTHDARVWNCPTLDYYATGREELSQLEKRDGLGYVTESDKASWRRREPSKVTEAAMGRLYREVRALQHAGAGLLVGSDAPEPWILPGFGLGEEMRQLAKAGLTPEEVMTAATRSPAQALGRDARDGAVQPGAVADLILVDRDPLQSVENASHPEVVMVRGRMWTRAELEASLPSSP
jgi:imidazolonepropionase-like amidohydrolase